MVNAKVTEVSELNRMRSTILKMKCLRLLSPKILESGKIIDRKIENYTEQQMGMTLKELGLGIN